MSSRDVLRKSRPKVEAVEISTGTVHVKGLNGAGRFQLMKQSADETLSDVQIAALGVCEADGSATFAKHEEAVKELGEIDGGDLKVIAAKVLEISGINVGEEPEKNSVASQN